jgi:hypothetical protein
MRALERLAPRRFELTVGEGLTPASPRRPIATLVRWSGTTFHWVTVVRANRFEVTFNHWGRQQTLGGRDFEGRWNFGSFVVAGLAMSLGQILPGTAIRPRH